MIFLVICQPLFYASIICISYVIHIFREAWSRRVHKIKVNEVIFLWHRKEQTGKEKRERRRERKREGDGGEKRRRGRGREEVIRNKRKLENRGFMAAKSWVLGRWGHCQEVMLMWQDLTCRPGGLIFFHAVGRNRFCW